MTLIRLKIRHFQKKIYDADTKSLIFQGYGVARCPIDCYDISFYINFNYSLLVVPSFAKCGNLFVLPIVSVVCIVLHVIAFYGDRIYMDYGRYL